MAMVGSTLGVSPHNLVDSACLQLHESKSPDLQLHVSVEKALLEVSDWASQDSVTDKSTASLEACIVDQHK